MKKSFLLCLLMAFMASWVTVQAETFLSEDFESGSMPTGWTTDGSGTWQVGTGDYSSSTGAGNGTYNALIKHGTTGNKTKLITPAMDLSAAPNATLSFMHIQRSWSGDTDNLTVYYRVSSESAWVELLAYTSAIASWTQEEDIALPNASATYQLAFEMTDAYGYGVAIDDVIVSTPAACAKPKNLALDGEVSATDAAITWEEVGAAESYEFAYSTSSTFPEEETIVLGDDEAELADYFDATTCFLDELQPATTYYVRVRAFCGGEDYSEWSSTFSFKTKCVAVSTFPWSENFDDVATNTLPDCWGRINTATSSYYASYPYVTSGGRTGNGLYFYAYGTSSSDEYAILPEMSDLDGKRIVFWAKGYYSGNKIQVGRMSNPADASTFVQIGEDIALTSSYQKYAVNMEESGDYIAIMLVGPTGYSTVGAYIDDITVEVKPACLEPSGLTYSDVTATGAILNWTASEDGETAWQICVNGDEENLIAVTEIPTYTFTNLTPLTDYTIKVRANCGETQSAWIDAVNFTTKAQPVAVGNSWSDDFEGASCGWERINGTQTNQWVWGEAVNNGGTHALYVSKDEGASNEYAGTESMVFATKLLTFETGKYQFSYDWRAYGETNWDFLRVFLIPSTVTLAAGTAPSSGFSSSSSTLPTGYIALDGGKLSDASSWTSKNLTVEMEAGDFYLVAAWKNDGSTNNQPAGAIDNVSIVKIACDYPVTGLLSKDITTTAANLFWDNSEATQWQVAYSANSSFPAEGTDLSVVSDTTKALEGLNPNTAYYARVRAYCGGEDFGAWSDVIDFRTGCAPYAAAAWTEDFEDGIYCWRMGNRQSASSNYIPYLSTSAKHNGDYGLYLRAYNANTVPADSSYAVLPEMNYGEKSLKDFSISFYARSTYNNVDAYNQHLLIGVVEDPVDSLATFVQVADVEVTDSYDLYEVSLANYTGAGQHIVLLATIPANYTGDLATLYGNFYVDDIALFETPACQALRKITISNVERRSMKVNLVPKIGVELGEYELVCSATKMDAAALEAAEKTAVAAASYEISGLDRETKYYIYVRANCGEEGASAWVCDSATTKALSACDPIQIGDGTSTANLVYTSYGNTYSQHIYTAEELIAAGYQQGVLSAVQFEYSGESSSYDKIQSVYIGTTEKSSFAGYTVSDFVGDLTLAYGPTELEYQKGWREYAFDTPFVWDGESNIVVGMLTNSTASSASGWSANGVSGSITRSICRYKDNTLIDVTNLASTTSYGTTSTNRPNIKFSFCYEVEACPAVSEMAFELVGDGTTEANVSWEISGADYLSGFDVILSDTAIVEFEGVEITVANHQDRTINFNALSAATEYHVYVRAICQGEGKDEGNSVWNHISFVTNANCPLVQNLNAELTDVNAVRVAWDLAFAEQEKHFQYILADVELDAEGIAAAEPVAVDDTTAFELSELAFEKEYHVYVASVCGATQHSDYVHVVFNTLPACQVVENLAVVRAKHNLVELSWTSAAFAKETQWEVGIVGDESKKQIVSERKVIFIGLEAETAYTAYVKAICSELESSAEATVGFTTAAQPGDCQQVGNGTNGGNMPVSNYDYAYTQMIYDASLIGKGGKITSIELKRSAYANVMNNMKIYLGTTDKAVFASTSDWVPASDLTLVYEGSFPVGTAEAPHLVLNLSTPFDYNGTDNLVVAVSNGHGNWNSIQNFYYTIASNTVLCNRADGTPSYADHPGTATANGGLSANRTNIEFCFEAKACPDVTALAVSDITTSSAKVSWEPMGSEIAWNVLISDHAITDFSEVEPARVENLYKIYDALLDDQDYFVYVQPADCEGAEFSMVSFRTVASCLAPINAAVVAESIEKHAARVIWVDPNVIPAGSYTVAYAKVNDFDLDDPMIATVQVTDTFADLSGLQADTVYKFAVKADCGGEDLSRYGVAAQFTTPQACFKPTNPGVVAESITATSATLFWKDEHDQAGYLVAYGPYNSFDINDPSTYTLANANDTFIVLTELQEATSYRFLVKSDCGEEGLSKEWSTYASFTTTCAAKALPFSEDFEDNNRFSYCWTKGNLDGNYSYIPTRSGSAKLNGEYGLYLSAYKYVSSYSASYNTDADSAYAVLPELNFGEEGIAAFQMSFNAKAYTSSYGSYYNHILIGVADDDELTNLEIVADQALTDAFAEYEVSFAAQAGNKRIVLFAIVDPESTESSRYGQVYVDDIYVSHVSDCNRPNGLAVSEITDNAATLAWVENGEAEAWQICINGNEENLIDVTENPYILSELTAATAYTVKVRANCGESQSEWSAEINFNTSVCAEADKKAIRYEIWDTYGDGWQNAILRVTHKTTNAEIASLTVSSSDGKDHVNGTLALCCGEEYEFIWISGTYDSECRLAVYDINNEIIIDQTSAKPTAGVLLDYTMDCVVPTCIKPVSLDAEVLSANSVKLDWTAGGEETFFQVVCVLSGEEPNWEGVEPIEALTITIDTLNIDNDYDFYVRAYCGESDHSDFRMVSAHVGYCVPAPTSIDGSGIIAIAFNEEDAYTEIHPTAAPFYADNKAIEFVAHADEIDSILITYSTGYTYGTVIWVDWNKNLAFEASEIVFSGESSESKPTTLSCVFAIPAETELGAYRLRIGGADSFFNGYINGTSSADPDPCGTGTYTIYEDYTLLIVEKPDEPTGISGAGIDDIVIKRIENNQVVIIRNGEKFTIMGVKIQ